MLALQDLCPEEPVTQIRNIQSHETMYTEVFSLSLPKAYLVKT